MTDVFAFIRSEKANFPVTWMCHKLGVARASFYRWLRPEKLTPTQQRHTTLTEHVRRVYDKENGKAGRDQIAFMLRNEGTRVAVGTVGSIIRELGLRAVRMSLGADHRPRPGCPDGAYPGPYARRSRGPRLYLRHSRDPPRRRYHLSEDRVRVAVFGDSDRQTLEFRDMYGIGYGP